MHDVLICISDEHRIPPIYTLLFQSESSVDSTPKNAKQGSTPSVASPMNPSISSSLAYLKSRSG